MANRFWVGGTATWDGTAGTKWATTSGGAGGAAVPTAADDVFFDAASGAVSVTLGNGAVALSINCTGFTGTWLGASSANTVTVAGSITLSSTMTQSAANTFVITGTGTITSAGKSFNTLTINGAGITVTLGSALSLSGGLTLTQGTLTTSASNYSITAATLNAAGSLVRTLTLNASTVTLTVAGATWTSQSNNFTFNAGTSTINFNGAGGFISCNTNGGATFYNVTVSSSSTGFAISNSSNSFNTLTLPSPTAGNTYQVNLPDSQTQTITTLIAAGSGPTGRLQITSTSFVATSTLAVTTYTTKSDVDFLAIIATGASAPWSGTRLGNMGSNSNITFAAAKTVYWNLGGSQNWSATGWAATSGGAPSSTNFPLAQDTAVFDNTGSAGTVTIEKSWAIGSLNMSSRTSAMTLNQSLYATISGNLTCGSGVTYTGITNYFVGNSNQTITSAGKTLAAVYIYKTAGTVSLGDALLLSGPMQVAGPCTFNAVSYNVTVQTFQIPAAYAATVNMGSGLWTLTSTAAVWAFNATATLNKGTANILLSDTTTTSRQFFGAGKSYNKLTIGGTTGISTLTITGGANTFTEIASTKTVAHTITFPAATTTTVGDFTVAGSSGNVVTINSSSAGSAATLSKSSGIVNVNYLSIRDSTATGGATWYAGANSTNVSNNTGWIFSGVPSGSGMMMTFFPV